MNTLVIVLIAAVLLSAAYVLYGAGLLINGELIQRQRHQRKNLRMEKAPLQYIFLNNHHTDPAYILTRIGSANIWPLFGSANQLLSALVERTIGLVKAYFKAQKESA